MIYVMQAATDYNDFKKTVVDRSRDEHSVSTKVRRVLEKKPASSDDEEAKKKSEAENLIEHLLGK